MRVLLLQEPLLIDLRFSGYVYAVVDFISNPGTPTKRRGYGYTRSHERRVRSLIEWFVWIGHV